MYLALKVFRKLFNSTIKSVWMWYGTYGTVSHVCVLFGMYVCVLFGLDGLQNHRYLDWD